MNADVIFSDDVEQLRNEIVRLRTYLDTEFKVSDCYRKECEHLTSIIQALISNHYGK